MGEPSVELVGGIGDFPANRRIVEPQFSQPLAGRSAPDHRESRLHGCGGSSDRRWSSTSCVVYQGPGPAASASAAAISSAVNGFSLGMTKLVVGETQPAKLPSGR